MQDPGGMAARDRALWLDSQEQLGELRRAAVLALRRTEEWEAASGSPTTSSMFS